MNGYALLAQTWWKKSTPADSTLFFVIVGLLFAVIVGTALVKRFLEAGTRPTPPPMLSKGSFRRRAGAMGFSDAETAFLDDYARRMGITNPQSVFGSRAMMDAFFKNVFKYIEKHSDTEEIAELAKNQLFAIREAMAIRISAGPPVKSTRQLVKKTPLSLIDAKGSHYSSIVVELDPRFIFVEPALDAFGQVIKFGWRSRLTVYFYTGNHMGFTFNTRVSSYVEYQGRRILAVRHSESIHPLPTRKHQRRQTTTPCRFFLVHVSVVRERGRSTRSIRTEKTAVPGMITDLSAGGMSIQTSSPAMAGEFLKVDFTLDSGERSVYATVVRTNRIRMGGNVMHVKFVKITRKTANEILAAVYDYE